MRLELFNFRCYRGVHAFTLDARGTTLISGSSGVGKTSLMMAIFFAITGSCPPKVITDGCDTCRVRLEWNANVTIVRTRRPNRVTITLDEQTFEDDLAQTYIDRLFGKHFDCTSYVQQQYQRTFVYLSPNEKLEILEKLCFGGEDLDPETVKRQCGIFQREVQHAHIELKSKLRTMEQLIATPIEPPECPEKLEVSELEILRRQLKQYQQDFKDVDHREYLLKRRTSVEELIARIPEVTMTESELNEQLYVIQELKAIQLYPDVWSKHSRDECDELIRDYTRDVAFLKEYTQVCHSIAKLEKYAMELEQLQAEYHHLLSVHEGEFVCPSCHVDLALVNNELVPRGPPRRSTRANPVVTPEEKKQRLKVMEGQLEQLRQKTRSLDHFRARQTELEQLIDPNETVETLEGDLSWIRSYIDEETRKEATNALWTKKQKDLQSRVRCEWSVKEIKVALEQVRERNQLTTQRESYQQQLKALENLMPRTELLHLMQCVERDIKRAETLQHRWEIYELKKTEYDTYLSRLASVEKYKQDLCKLEQRMNALSELKQLILRTESEIIEHKIAEISHLVNVYAEQIFASPITVEMRTTKKTQTNSEKVQVQLEVYYKNMCCDISLLSGGEQARLNLAFILAFAHVFQSPLLLLDECTSNLDQELTEVVLEHIDSVGISKVILIAHQVVEGNFAQILKLQ